MSLCIGICISSSDSLCHFKPISSILHNFSLRGEKNAGLFDMRLLTVHVCTATTEEMLSLYQINSSAGASGAASHGHRQQAEKLFSMPWTSLDDLGVLDWVCRIKEASYTQTLLIINICVGFGNKKEFCETKTHG